MKRRKTLRKTLRTRSNKRSNKRSTRRSGGKRTAKQIVRQREIGAIYADLSSSKAKQAMRLVRRLRGEE